MTARYGSAPDFALVENAFVRHILQHRSVRAFDSRPLSDGTLQTLVAAAQSGSSSSNL